MQESIACWLQRADLLLSNIRKLTDKSAFDDTEHDHLEFLPTSTESAEPPIRPDESMQDVAGPNLATLSTLTDDPMKEG